MKTPTFVLLMAIALSSVPALALDQCKLENHRSFGTTPTLYVRLGAKTEKFEKYDKAVAYLKTVDGKDCEVPWGEARDILNRIKFSDNDATEESIKYVDDRAADYGKQKKDTPTLASAPSPSSDAKLTLIRQKIQTLDSDVYNSREKRAALIQEINAILK